MTEAAKEKRVRTCIGCGKQSDKVTLLRIVRSPEGQVSFDASGRAAGRGAYVCSVACFDTARKQKKLQRALKMAVEENVADHVRSELEKATGVAGEQ
ncbi:MAG: YlxR family protein [Eggerthellaceae bacterium]|nr:YlxR family protein [Eggerthellaceae bacterium]